MSFNQDRQIIARQNASNISFYAAEFGQAQAAGDTAKADRMAAAVRKTAESTRNAVGDTQADAQLMKARGIARRQIDNAKKAVAA